MNSKMTAVVIHFKIMKYLIPIDTNEFNKKMSMEPIYHASLIKSEPTCYEKCCYC